MLLYLVRRLGMILLISGCIVYFSFLGMNMMGPRQVADSDSRLPIMERLEDAVPAAGKQSVDFFSGLLRSDLGNVPTVSGERPVSEIARDSYQKSIGLILAALGLASLVGFAAGILAALARQKRREYFILVLSMIGISAPSFLIAVLLQQGGIKYTTTFGVQLVSMGGYGWDFKHLVMPLIVLTVRPLANITSTTFTSLSRILEEDYMRTAFSKGLSRPAAVRVHALRNLGVSVLTSIGISLRFSLSALPLVEYIFAWPGMGLRILEAINDRIPLQVAALAFAIGLTIQLAFLLLDLLYRWIDPRMRQAA